MFDKVEYQLYNSVNVSERYNNYLGESCMEEVKDNIVHIKDKSICLYDLCQVITASNDMPELIVQRFDFIGTYEECLEKIKNTNVKPEKGTHFSIATNRWFTNDKEYANYGLTALRKED